MEISAVAVRTDVNGAWEPIDTSLVEGLAGIEVVAPALPITFSDGTDGMPLATIRSDDHALEFHAPFDLSTPTIEGDRVTYPQVLPGVDLIASVDEDGSGFSEVLRVDSPEAAANPALAELEFPVTVTGGLTVTESEGGFVAADAGGDEVFSSPTPLMWDSGSTADGGGNVAAARASTLVAAEDSVDPVTGEPLGEPVDSPALDSDVAKMPVEVSGEVVSITPDAQMIADPDTSWPIYIDPSVGRDPVEWTAIRSGMSSDWKFSGDQGLGFCDVSVESSCGQDFKSRLVWEFQDLGPVAELAAGDIVYGNFTAYGTHSYNCTSYAVQAYRVENIASGTTWDSNSGWTDSRLQSSRDVHHKSGCPSGPQRITWDVTDAAKQAATDGGYLSIGLKDYDENSMSRWKRYRNDATLSIAFNRAPATPNGRHAVTEDANYPCSGESGTDSMRTLTPTLKATAIDLDEEYGQKVRMRFQVLNSAGTEVWESGLTTAQASGQEHAVKVPSGELGDEKVYQWRAQAQDVTVSAENSRASSWTATCYIRPDMTPPNKPTVTSSVYPVNKVGGGIGVTGTFKFEPNESTDVVKYAYSFNSDALDCSTIDPDRCLAGSSVTKTLTPTLGGSQVLYVQSFDKAGRGSPVNVYRFGVQFPNAAGYWHLDEGGKDSAPGGAKPLTISSSTTAVDGVFKEFGVNPDDKALSFDSTSDTAFTDGPVVNTAGSFSVTAFVSPDVATSAVQTAVSQDAYDYGGFKLGRLTSSHCAEGMTTCWGFWKTNADDYGSGNAMAVSDIPVIPGEWTHLTGVYDASTKKVSLYVCPIGTASAPAAGAGEPVLEQETTYTGTSWTAGGPVQIGRGLASGVLKENWVGRIDDPRLYNAALPIPTIRSICQGDQS
ncbi:MAG TPA: LamG domain-containing protein [Mycobacterium sp.]